MKTTIRATIIENVVPKGRKRTHFGPKCAQFPSENANLTNGTQFTHIRGGGNTYCRAALQNKLLRPQKVALIWSLPVSSKENDGAWTNAGGGKHIIGGDRGGVPSRFLGRGFMVCFP